MPPVRCPDGLRQAAQRQVPLYGDKTFCSNCKVHCYKPDMRERIRQVMAFSGPRMLFHHPAAALRHVIETKREKKALEEKP